MDSRSIAPALHCLGEWGIVEDMGIVGPAHPGGNNVGEAALVVDDTQQDNGEIALVADKCPHTLGWVEDGKMDAILMQLGKPMR